MLKNKTLIIIIASVSVIVIAGILIYFLGGISDNKNERENGAEKTQSPSSTQTASPVPTGTPESTATPTYTPSPTPTPSPSPTPDPFADLDAKAVYLTGGSAGNSGVIDNIIGIANRTELNAVVIDAKAEKVNYESGIPFVKENNLDIKLFDPESVLKKLHDNNIYCIARIVCFKDHYFAAKRADLAIKTNSGEIFREGGIAWVNPYNKEVWQYNIDIAKEAAEKGFDEIQFDYVRFPTGTGGKVNYGENPPSRSDAITGFLKAAVDVLHPMGVKVSADIFGIVLESETDGRYLGQELEKVGMDIDYISPMIYPSHYSNAANHGLFANGRGQELNGVHFDAPDLEPYGIVYQSLIKAKSRLGNVQGYKADIRPYLQAFTLSSIAEGYYQHYGAKQIKEQIKATYDAGYKGWLLWSPSNYYPEDAFAPVTADTGSGEVEKPAGNN